MSQKALFSGEKDQRIFSPPRLKNRHTAARNSHSLFWCRTTTPSLFLSLFLSLSLSPTWTLCEGKARRGRRSRGGRSWRGAAMVTWTATIPSVRTSESLGWRCERGREGERERGRERGEGEGEGEGLKEDCRTILFSGGGIRGKVRHSRGYSFLHFCLMFCFCSIDRRTKSGTFTLSSKSDRFVFTLEERPLPTIHSHFLTCILFLFSQWWRGLW